MKAFGKDLVKDIAKDAAEDALKDALHDADVDTDLMKDGAKLGLKVAGKDEHLFEDGAAMLGKSAAEAAGDQMKQMRTISVDPASAAMGNRMTMKMSYTATGNVSDTILSPHLVTIKTGSMRISLDNPGMTRSTHEPVTGKIKINLTEPFEAKKLTVTLIGYLRSHFFSDPRAD